MKCRLKTLYTETRQYGYETFIRVEIRQWSNGLDTDTVMDSCVSECDNALVSEHVVLPAAIDSALQRKGIATLDALVAQYGERLEQYCNKPPQSVPLEF